MIALPGKLPRRHEAGSSGITVETPQFSGQGRNKNAVLANSLKSCDNDHRQFLEKKVVVGRRPEIAVSAGVFLYGGPFRVPDERDAAGTRGSLGVADQAAWAEFVERYGRKIYQWCLRWRLQTADAEDVTQVVLLKLATRMKEFSYDPGRSFRAWLKTVAYHAWKDFAESKRRAGVGQGNDEGLAALQTIEAARTSSRDWRSSSTWN